MSRRARIVYIITRTNLGGAQKHLLWLLEAVQETFDPVVLVGETGYLTDKLEARKIVFEHVDSLGREPSPVRDFTALLELRRTLRRLAPDLIHLHSFKAAMLGRIAAWRLGIPIVVTAHGWSFTDGNPRIRRLAGPFLERTLAPITDAIIVVCDSDREAALNNRIASDTKFVTILNGAPWRPAPRSRQLANQELQLLNIGRICAQKDQMGLVDLVPLLPANTSLRLVGDGPDRARLLERISASGLDGRILVEEETPEPDFYLDHADIYVSWSRWEGMSLSLIEALRAGLPIVATDVGGTQEIVESGTNGFLVPHGDREGFASAISELVENPDLRIRLGIESRRRFEKLFQVDFSIERTSRLYRHLLRTGTNFAIGPDMPLGPS